MRTFKYIAFLFLASVCLLGVILMPSAKESREAAGPAGQLTVLFAGLDDAAANTDVLMLVDLDLDGRAVTVLQLPRDTYFHNEVYAGKINGLYPTYLAKGMKPEEALRTMCSDISRCLGVAVDRYVAVGTEAFASVIDALGGVSVDLPAPIVYREGDGYAEMPAGERLLSGKEALRFIRFRSAYIEGDLGRMDAQKLLLAAVYRKVKSELSLSSLAAIFPKVYPSLVTDMTISEEISYANAVLRERDAFGVRLLTLPGEATYEKEDGRWYYVANRASAAEVTSLYFRDARDFDPGELLLDKTRLAFRNIYYDKNCEYTVYTEDTIGDLDVKTKQE